MAAAAGQYSPHPYTGGRDAALRALTVWWTRRPGSPRVLVLTGSPGSGVTRLVTGFLMLCDPEFRERLPLDDLDPATVPPDGRAPAVVVAEGLTTTQFLWLIADRFGLPAARTGEIPARLASLGESVALVVPDVDRAGPLRSVDEPARLVREALAPLAATGTVRLLVDAPRAHAAELLAGLPPGTGRIIDLDEPPWADREALVRQAEQALSPGHGAPELPFTTDVAARRHLARAIARRAGTAPLVVHLAVNCALTAPRGVEPGTDSWLPSSVGEALDLHARRLGADPATLRLMLAPLALCERAALPAHLWARLASAVAGRDMSRDVADGMALAGPFVQPLPDSGEDGASLRLLHPALAEEIRRDLPDEAAAQARIAVALLQAVPGNDWSRAAAYVRDGIAGHALAAGQLPHLLTDPGLFVHADPVALRAAVESVDAGVLGRPARSYLRTAPLITRTEADAPLRAALLETAFVQDGLPAYAEAVRGLGLDLPWRTLWSVAVRGITGVTVGTHPRSETPAGTAEFSVSAPESGGAVTAADEPVAALVVPDGTPGALPLGASTVLVRALTASAPSGELRPERVTRRSDDSAASRFVLSRGADYLRVWDRTTQDVVAALVSDPPITAAALSPDGFLLVATERGATALRLALPEPAAPASPEPAHRPQEV